MNVPDPSRERTTATASFARFGFTARDWHRIMTRADAVTPDRPLPALDDLAAPFRVRAVTGDQGREPYGELVTVYRDRLILAWAHERLPKRREPLEKTD